MPKSVLAKPLPHNLEIEVAPLTSNLSIIKTDPDIVAVSSEIPTIASRISKIRVVDATTSETLTELVATVVRSGKTLETMRKRFVDPLNQHVKFINSLFKKLAEPGERAEQEGRAKLTTYLREQREAAQKKADDETRRYEQQVRKAEVRHQPLPPPPEEVTYQAGTRTESASAGTRLVPRFELLNLANVPQEYLILDEAKVRRVLKAGIRTIPGLRIWEEDELAIRT